jgi:hypothetical protein
MKDYALAFFGGFIFLFVVSWITVFDVIHTDKDGNPVVCDVNGIFRTIDTPECQTALAGRWNRQDKFIWRGTCDPTTKECTPTK